MSRILRGARFGALGAAAALVAVVSYTGVAAAGNGGGSGSSGSSIWAWTWWNGSPTGPGPDVAPPGSSGDVCIWHDVGPSIASLDSALAGAGLPSSFWQGGQSGAHVGIWGVDLWARGLARTSSGVAHFDLVACPHLDQVPPAGGDVEAGLPAVRSPSGDGDLWIYWDTVVDPPAANPGPLVEEAFARAELPSPAISTAPYSVGAVSDATIVNLPTWLWVSSPSWSPVVATASGGGLVATVWATPVSVTWQAAWDLSTTASNPQGGVDVVPEALDLVCPGPGTPYDPAVAVGSQSTPCAATFTQSTFGTDQVLSASIDWQVHWALSSSAGVVGGEGLYPDSTTTSSRPLRVMQVESIITSG